ncbi:MAG: hypothetical protein M3Q56_00145 [Bacteroidota bacterium]|nr:hypothetical protein [Bacteroidota bacterium]
MDNRYGIYLLIKAISIAFAILLPKDSSATIFPRNKMNTRDFKYWEVGIVYNQLNRGFFEGNFTYYKNLRNTYAGFYEQTIGAGYSPWKNAFVVETNHRLQLFVLAGGLGAGYCFNNDGDKQQWFIKPEIGLNLFYFQIFYQYTFLSKNPFLYKEGSSFFIRIPICATGQFFSFNEPKTWHLGSFVMQ